MPLSTDTAAHLTLTSLNSPALNPTAQRLKEMILQKTARVAVVGAGYVGLPLAVEKAKVGFPVIAIDQNPRRVDMLNRGENYILVNIATGEESNLR